MQKNYKIIFLLSYFILIFLFYILLDYFNIDNFLNPKFLLSNLNEYISDSYNFKLIFYNVYEGTNKKHHLSEHAGMPVIKGEKWAFNLWLREK